MSAQLARPFCVAVAFATIAATLASAQLPIGITRSLQAADAIIQGAGVGDTMGWTVAGAGDVDGDGFADVLIGAPQLGVGPGKAYLFHGPVQGVLGAGEAAATWTGAATGDALGWSVDGGGDVNGDGTPDILIGARDNDAAGANAGAVYLFYGPVAGALTPADADLTLLGEATGDGAGFDAAFAGDVNDDGFDDILVGAIFNDAGGGNAGAVYLVYGSAGLAGTRSLAQADAKLLGQAVGNNAGWRVAGAGDVNDDGHADILVSAIFNTRGGPFAGTIYLVYGSAALAGVRSLGQADLAFLGDANDLAGRALAGAGDVNGDGVDDFLIGAPDRDGDDDGKREGQAYLYYGGTLLDVHSRNTRELRLSQAPVKFDAETEDDFVGFDLAGLGDANGDGLGDILVTAVQRSGPGGAFSGATYVVLGAPVLPPTVPLAIAQLEYHGEGAFHFAGFGADAAGDVDGDGLADAIVGAPFSARGTVYVVGGEALVDVPLRGATVVGSVRALLVEP